MNMILQRSFYARDTVLVAQELLGKIIVRTIDGKIQKAMIVETEAYRSTDDPACHAFRGKTKRTEPLFGPVGHLYVYFIYGNHYCMNIVSKDQTTPAGGVLIRGVELYNDDGSTNRINGPGRVTKALGIAKNDNNLDVTVQGKLYVTEGKHIDPAAIIVTPRIGISTACDKFWRFILTVKI